MYDVNVCVSMYLPQHTYVSRKTAMQEGRSFLSSRDQTQIVLDFCWAICPALAL